MIRDFALVNADGEILARRQLDDADCGELGTVAAGKPRYVPIETDEAPSYNPATQVLVGPTETLGTERLAIGYSVRPKNSGEIAAEKASKIAAIKAEAGSRILALYPDWKQRNMTAAGVDLVRTRIAREWTDEEAAEAEALGSAWAIVRAIRGRSDDLEAVLSGLATAAAVAAFDPLAGWDD